MKEGGLNQRESFEKAKVVECIEYLPDNTAAESMADPTEAVVFFPGWKMSAGHGNVANICKAFANKSKSRVFAITTRSLERKDWKPMGKPQDFLFEEARVAVDRISSLGIRNVTLVGHSQGGGKAIDAEVLLQHYPDIQVRGLALINSVGLVANGSLDLAYEFVRKGADTATPEKWSMLQKVQAKARVAGASANVMKNIAAEMAHSGKQMARTFASEIDEMGGRNPHMDEVRAPIVILQSEEDSIADRTQPYFLEHDKKDEREGVVDKPIYFIKEDGTQEMRGGTGELLKGKELRESNMRKHTFPQSVKIDVMQVPGSHALPLIRPESVANILEKFNRYWRTQEKTEPTSALES